MDSVLRSDTIGKSNEKPVPQFAVLELSQKCNLRCIHCYNNRYPDKDELSLSETFSIIRRLADIKISRLDFTGGEPLMHKHFFEIAGFARKLGFNLGLSTNATLISEEIADRIAALSMVLIKVTLYGHNENIYEKITGRKMFHAAVAGLRALSSRKLPVMLSPCAFFNFLSIQDMRKMRKIIVSLGFKLRPLQMYFSPKVNAGSISPLEYNIIDEAQYEACLHAFPPRPMKLFSLNRNPNMGVCGTPERERIPAIFINAYGQVGNCVYVQSKESIREKDFLEIWRIHKWVIYGYFTYINTVVRKKE